MCVVCTQETHMLKLEMQLSELLEEVNASSPEILPKLSMTDPRTLTSLAPTSDKRPLQPISTTERQTKTKTLTSNTR